MMEEFEAIWTTRVKANNIMTAQKKMRMMFKKTASKKGTINLCNIESVTEKEDRECIQRKIYEGE